MTSAKGHASSPWPPAAAQPRTSPQRRPRTAAGTVPSSRAPAALIRTTRQASSTCRIESVAPSTIAVSSWRSRSRVSRSWALRRATASSWRESWTTRSPSGSSARPLAGSVQRTRSSDVGPSPRTRTVAPGVRADHSRAAARSECSSGSSIEGGLPTDAAMRRTPEPGRLSHRAPPDAPHRRMTSTRTADARSDRGPPEVSSWLNWYCANIASASRWASSNVRRVSRSRAAMRSRSASVLGPVIVRAGASAR